MAIRYAFTDQPLSAGLSLDPDDALFDKWAELDEKAGS